MANKSEAFGTITIQADKAETVQSLLKLFKKASEAEYSTHLEDCVRENPTDVKYEFWGEGKWTYYNTIQFMPTAYLEALDSKEIEGLINSYWLINYEYTDYEPGFEALLKGEVSHSHKTGDPIEKVKEVQFFTEYDFTWANIAELVFDDDLNEFLESEKNYLFDEVDMDYLERTLYKEISSLLKHYDTDEKGLCEKFEKFNQLYQMIPEK